MDHHILLFQDAADQPLGALDSQEDIVGYSCFEGASWILDKRKIRGSEQGNEGHRVSECAGLEV